MRLSQIGPHLRQGDVVVATVTWNDAITDQISAVDRDLGPRRCASATRPRADRLIACLIEPLIVYQGGNTWRKRLYRRTGLFVPSFASIKGFADTVTFASAAAYILVPRVKLIYYRLRPRETFQMKLPATSFRDNVVLLARVSDRLARAGARFVVFLLPNRISYDNHYYTAYTQGGTVFPAPDFLFHYLVPHCQRFGLTCVSLYPALAGKPKDHFNFPFDGHLNKRGAAAIAVAIHSNLSGILRFEQKR